MFQTLVKSDVLAVPDQTFLVKYFEIRTLGGARSYCAEILLGADRIILDDDSMTNLEMKTSQLVAATLCSRMLAGRSIDSSCAWRPV